MGYVSKVVGLYKPGGTTYAVYEAILPNGDRFASGAFSEEEFRGLVQRFHGRLAARKAEVRVMPAIEDERGYMWVEEEFDSPVEEW